MPPTKSCLGNHWFRRIAFRGAYIRSSLLENFFFKIGAVSLAFSIQSRVRPWGDGVEQKKALRTCEEFLAVGVC